MPSAFSELSLATPLAAAINALLDAQPMALSRLQRHVGKTLRLALPALPMDLTLDENGRLGPSIETAETAPDLILTPLPSALPLLLGNGKLADLFHVEGDGLFASDLSGALADFDWVLALRPYLGDIAASRVDQFLRGILAWRQQAHDDAGANLVEYAVYEQAILAEPAASRTFVNAVDTLREDVDRLEARLRLLEQSRNKS
jgi:ubiquinone biosynthesis accessory factor UbiJ